jgi:hypothetical protein
VIDASRARVDGRPLTAAQQRTLSAASGGISVAYRLVDLHARRESNGTVLVTGRAVRADRVPAPGVVLLSYRLEGTVTDASGKPVEGATVVTRTLDRDFWTFSLPSNAAGHYVSFFSASDSQGVDPVPLSVQVASGRTSYSAGQLATVGFKRLSSATMNVKLPQSGTALPLPAATAIPGALYRGLLVGVAGPEGLLKPVSARWPDAQGRFSLVLPRLPRGTSLSIWQSDFVTYSATPARPGGPVDTNAWPSGLTDRVPAGIAVVRVGS